MEKDTRQLDPGKGTAAEEFTLWRLFTSFFRIGLLTIGGGLAMVPQMERICVTEKKWLSPEDMIDCLALAQALPGVLAINSATFIGNKLRGLRGALVATLAVILPSFLIILCVVNILGFIGDEPHVQGAMTGIKAAVCGSIVAVAYRMGKRILKDVFGWIMAVGAFVAIAVLHIDTALVIVCAAVLGILYQMIRTKTKGKDIEPGRRGGEVMTLLKALFALFCAFFKIGLFGFGGGIAMLPLIGQTMQSFGILSGSEFGNLVAISQVTPGPIAVNAATYAGFKYAGVLGSVAATVGVALPSLILVLTIMHFMNKYKESSVMQGISTGIKPATVGLIASAVVVMAETAIYVGKAGGEAAFIAGSGLDMTIGGFALVPCLMFLVTAILTLTTKIDPLIPMLVMGVLGAFLCC